MFDYLINSTITDWNQPVIPPRSRFYSLEPVNIGTAWVESLNSYLGQLAAAHRVSVRTLVLKEILPLFDKPYLANSEYHSLSTFWTTNSRALNGTGSWASDWVQILEKLTLLPWADVIPARGLLRPSRAWCPGCYEEWYQTSQVIYDPLLWAIEVVAACPRHQRRLSLNCSNCKKSLPHLAPQLRLGHCSHCHHWLGQDHAVEPLSEAEVKWQGWVVDAVGEMIAAAPSLLEWPHREIVVEKISDWVERISGGNASGFASVLQEANIPISKWSIWDWQQGQQLPKLGMVLRMCYFFGTTPLRFFTQEVEPSISIQTNLPELSPIKQEPGLNREPFDAQKLLTGLKVVLADDEGPPSSLATVSQSLDHDQSHLLTLFPSECHEISKRYREYIRTRSIQRKQRVRSEVRQATLRVHAEGQYPSRRRVRALLSNSALMRLPEAVEAWHETLQELGWNKDESCSRVSPKKQE